VKISKNNLIDFIGVLLIFLFVLRFISLLRGETIIHIFWLCNHVPLIMGIAILLRSSFWLTAEISFLFFGFLGWIIDYLSKMFFGIHILGTTSYLFPITDPVFFYATATAHILTIPLALIAYFLIKKQEPSAWKGALIHAIVLIPFLIYFGEHYNLNCFLKPCVDWVTNFTLYPLAIFAVYFLVLVIPINYILVKISKKYQ